MLVQADSHGMLMGLVLFYRFRGAHGDKETTEGLNYPILSTISYLHSRLLESGLAQASRRTSLDGVGFRPRWVSSVEQGLMSR